MDQCAQLSPRLTLEASVSSEPWGRGTQALGGGQGWADSGHGAQGLPSGISLID